MDSKHYNYRNLQRLNRAAVYDGITTEPKKKKELQKSLASKFKKCLLENNWNIRDAIDKFFIENEKLKIDRKIIENWAKDIIEGNIDTLVDFLGENDEEEAVRRIKQEINSDYIPKDWIWTARKNILFKMLLENFCNGDLAAEEYIKAKLPEIKDKQRAKAILKRIAEKIAIEYKPVYDKMMDYLDLKNYDINCAVEEYMNEKKNKNRKTDSVEKSQKTELEVLKESFKKGINAEDAIKRRELTAIAESINNKIKDLLKKYMSDIDLSYDEVFQTVHSIINNRAIPYEWIDNARIYRFRACLKNGSTLQETIKRMQDKGIISESFQVPDSWIRDAKYEVIKPILYQEIKYPNVNDENISDIVFEKTGIRINDDDMVLIEVRNDILAHRIAKCSEDTGEFNIDKLCEMIGNETGINVIEDCKIAVLDIIAIRIADDLLNEGKETFVYIVNQIKELTGEKSLTDELKNKIRTMIDNRKKAKENPFFF